MVSQLEDRSVPSSTTTVAAPYAVGLPAGQAGSIVVYNADGSVDYQIADPYGASYTGGVRVVLADVTGDGVPDLITAPGAGINVVPPFTPGVAGIWEVIVSVTTGVAGAAADVANMQLNKTGVSYTRLANPANGAVTFGPYRITLNVTDTLGVVAIGAGTAAVVYGATVSAKRVG